MRRSNIAIALIITTLPLFGGCLWILMEKYGYGSYTIQNNSSHNVCFVAYYSEAYPFYSSYDTIGPIVVHHNDTIAIGSAEVYTKRYSSMGAGYQETDLEIIFRRDIASNIETFPDVYYDDTIRIEYGYIDSIAIVFDNSRHITIQNKSKRPIFKEFNEFWKENNRSNKECHSKKGDTHCTYTYFITDEMYELAEPFCR